MYYLKVKDKKFRKNFYLLEKKVKLQKFIKTNLYSIVHSHKKFSETYKKKIYYQLLKKKKKNFLLKIIRRCVLTNRSKSLQFLKISRMQSKELISFGIIPGYTKAVW